MRAAEILRNLADIIDKAETGLADPESQSSIQLTKVDSDMPGEHEPTELDPNPVMVPPLQQKLELLKKAVNMPNVFDQEDQSEPDELSSIKKNAGIAAIHHEASEDNDITG